MRASQRWRAMVEAEHAQSDRMCNGPPPGDHWHDHAEHFRADPRRTDDPLVDRLLKEVAPHNTVIDVGAGGGRIALPLALRCRHVTAVEPSPSMASVLRQQSEEHGIANVSLVQARWEEAEVGQADIMLCIHVLYVVRDIKHFVRKLSTHGREWVVVVLFRSPPQSQLYRLWKLVHGEERLPLPGLPDLDDVLQEMEIDAHLEMLPPQSSRGYEDAQQALEQIAGRLYLTPDSEKWRTLERALPDLLEETDGTFKIEGIPALEPGLLSWRPAL